MPQRHDAAANERLDPVVTSSLRELIWIVCAWAVSFTWVIGYCAWDGYGADGSDVRLILGMPSWVFWGILVPWIAVTAFTIWFALTRMADHPLDVDQTDPGTGASIESDSGDAGHE